VLVQGEELDDDDPEQDRDERAGNDGSDPPEQQDQRQGEQPDQQRRPAGLAELAEQVPELLEEVAVALGDPNSFGSCPATMVRARPMMKPLSTGSEMKLARKPSRSSPATTPMTPVVIASVTVSTTNRLLPWVARSATAAADRAAVADIGPATRCLELPKAA
jgi:hypothetical protein